MVDFAGVRAAIAPRLNLIKCEHRIPFGNSAELFGHGRVLGVYDRDLVSYFMGESATHPITPLIYLATAQSGGVADEVLAVVLGGVAEVADELPELARKRVETWQKAPEGSRLALEVSDDIAYRIMRPSIDYMLGHYVGSNYRTATLLGQLTAWFLGDPHMDQLPTARFKTGVTMSVPMRFNYEQLVLRNLRVVFEANRLEPGERVQQHG